MRPLNITRLTVHGDVPSSVLSSDGDTTQTTTLPSGSRLFTAVGNDGVRVSTLSRDGQLTQWEAPAISAQRPDFLAPPALQLLTAHLQWVDLPRGHR